MSGLDEMMAAALGALTNTLNGQSSMEGQQDQSQQDLQAQVNAASQAASQAGQQYQQTAAQAPPQVNPLEQSTGLGLGNAASVLSGNPYYQQRAHAEITRKTEDLMKSRLENLQALKDNFDQKAKAAEQLGNLQVAGESRLKAEQLSKTMQTILEAQKAKYANDLEAQRQQGRIDLQKQKDQENADKTKQAAGYFDSLTDTTPSGNTWIDSTNLPNDKDVKGQFLQYAKDNHLMVADKGTAERLRSAKEVFNSFDDIEQVMKSKLYPGTDPAGTAAHALKNQALASTQIDPDLASWGNTQLVAIRNIQALAAGVGSGFRLNENEIRRAVANFPKLTDNLPTAERKLKWERQFLLNKEKAFFGKNWKPPANQTPAADPQIKAQAMKAARTQDNAGLEALVKAHPELNDDPDLNALVK